MTESAVGEWRSGWPVVLGSTVATATAYGAFAFVASLFIEPLHQAFGWSRGEYALGLTLGQTAFLFAPAVGLLADRYGVRRVALTGLPLMIAVLLGLAAMNGSLPLFYALMFLLPLFGLGPSGGLVFARAITSWFTRSRALALAMPRLGVATAGAVLPPIVFMVMERHGWREGYLVLAGIATLVCLPATFWLIRERPAPKAPPRVVAQPARSHVVADRARLVRLCLAIGLTIGPASGLLSQLHPLLVSKGAEPFAAAAMTSLIGVSVLMGGLMTGMLADRFWAPGVGSCLTVAAVGGCALIGFAQWLPTYAALCAGLVLVGIGQGAELDLSGYLVSRYFGFDRFAWTLGMIVLVSAVFQAGFVYGFGAIYDWTGSYDPALLAAAVSMAGASVFYVSLGRYPSGTGVIGQVSA